MYVHQEIETDFISIFVAKVKNLKFGNPFEKSTTIGPLINVRGLKKVKAQIDDALSQGAILHCGNEFIYIKYLLVII